MQSEKPETIIFKDIWKRLKINKLHKITPIIIITKIVWNHIFKYLTLKTSAENEHIRRNLDKN